MTHEEARALVEDHLRGDRRSGDPELVIEDRATMEHSWGWVFFYQSRAYLETGNLSDALVGNAPLIVDRVSGRLHETGTADPIETYIHSFEVTGDPHGRPGRCVEVYAADASADCIGAARLLSRACSVGIVHAKRSLDAVAAGTSCRFDARSPEEARRRGRKPSAADHATATVTRAQGSADSVRFAAEAEEKRYAVDAEGTTTQVSIES
jgi:hypothetical protein